MADFGGVLQQPGIVDRTYAMPMALFAYTMLIVTAQPTAGAHASGGVVHSIAPGTSNYGGRIATEGSVGYLWFGRVHLIPRKTFSFGTIVATVTDTFEIFNANAIAVVFTTFTNNIGDGISVPDLPATPATLSAFTSFVDPDSAGLIAYTGVGFDVSFLPLTLVVDRDGPPQFDDTLDFLFSSQQVSLRATGSRVSTFLATYEWPFVERWQFLTDVLESQSGVEQVLSLIEYPLQSFEFQFVLDGTDRQRFENLLFGAQSQLLAIPLWHEDVFTTAAASLSATSISVSSTTDADFRVGGYAIVFTSPTSYDIVLLSAVATGTLTFATTPLLAGYAAGTRVAPIRLGYIIGNPQTARPPKNVKRFRLVFRVKDNDTGMFTGSTSGWSSLSSKVVIDDVDVMESNEKSGEMDHRVTIIDSETGVVDVRTDWDTNKRTQPKTFAMRSRAQYRKVKRLLLALRGPQRSWYKPTYDEDFTVVATLTSGAFTMDVSNIGYTKQVQSRSPRNVIRVEFTDGTSVDRTIASSVEVSATVERLTLSVAWASTKLATEVRRVMYLELSRFRTDTFAFNHRGPANITLTAPARTLLP